MTDIVLLLFMCDPFFFQINTHCNMHNIFCGGGVGNLLIIFSFVRPPIRPSVRLSECLPFIAGVGLVAGALQ